MLAQSLRGPADLLDGVLWLGIDDPKAPGLICRAVAGDLAKADRLYAEGLLAETTLAGLMSQLLC